MSVSSRRRVTGIIAIAVAAVLAVATPAVAKKPDGQAGKGGGSAPTATQLRLGVDGGQTLPATPGSEGNVYVVAGSPFSVTVDFLDDAGTPTPLTTTSDVSVTLTASAPVSGLPATQTVVPGQLSATFTSLTSASEPDLTITATANLKGNKRIVARTSFDVLIESEPIATTGRTSIGGTDGLEGCVATPELPICADLLPPLGMQFTDGGLLSRGECAAGECRDSYVQALVLFAPDRTNPATLVMKCDKTLCGGGGITKKQLEVQLRPTDTPTVAPACPAKGVVGADQAFCVDYVQSTRDNAGDSWLFLLFVEDAKVRWP